MKYFLHILYVVSLLFFSACPSFAGSSFDTTITPQEKAVFAFFRAVGVPPDYDFWLKSTRFYESLPSDRKREDFVIREIIRLGRGYGEFEVDRDLLEIKTNIVARYREAESEGEKPSIEFRFFGLGAEKTPSFNFPFGKGLFSLVLNRLDGFSDLKLSEEEAAVVSTKVPYFGDDFDATLYIHTKVVQANYDHQIPTKNLYVWPMLGEIGYIKCVYQSVYSQQEVVLWEYLAPWYKEQYTLKNTPEEEKYPHPYDLFKD